MAVKCTDKPTQTHQTVHSHYVLAYLSIGIDSKTEHFTLLLLTAGLVFVNTNIFSLAMV